MRGAELGGQFVKRETQVRRCGDGEFLRGGERRGGYANHERRQ